MLKRKYLRGAVVMSIILSVLSLSLAGSSAQRKRPVKHAAICGNPQVACKTVATFKPNDLPFRVPENAVIVDTQLFYAVILKSIPANEDECDKFIPETDRLAAQALFPDRKVFSSRCVDIENLFYTNVNPKSRMMAVYAGLTLVEAKRVLADVKATGKFPGANIRQMRTGFNGT